MNDVALTVRQLRYEQVIFWRTPATVFFTLAFPVLLLLIFGSLSDGSPMPAAGGATFVEFFTPSMAVFGLMSTCYGNVLARTTLRRETGLLQRVRATPLPLTALLGGLLGNAVLVSALLFGVVLTTGALVWDVALPGDWAAIAGVVIVGGAAFCALGIAASTFVPNVETADPVVFATLLPVAFISGGFMPVRDGTLLAGIAEFLPVRHLLLAGVGASDGASPGAIWLHLGVVALWGVVGAAVAARRFRWAPSTS